MATQAEINQHDAIIERLTREFGRGLRPLFDQIFVEIANLGPNLTRPQIVALFFPVRQYLSSIDLQTIIDSNNNIMSDVIPATVTQQTATQATQLRGEVVALLQNELDNERQTFIETLVLAGIVGATLVPILTQLRMSITKTINRLRQAFDFAVRNFDGAFTLLKATLAGIDTFKYVGGTIPTSRQFCINHNGKTMTKREIERVWRSQSWGGKAPGNPFVVRGGYNCRHFFIPVKPSVT